MTREPQKGTTGLRNEYYRFAREVAPTHFC
jgi:hypothetical protein